mgnify:FL=1
MGLLFNRRPIRLFVFSCAFLVAGELHIFGTFDFNQNGQSEILKLNGLNAPLELVELNDDGSHKTLWLYTPEDGEKIVDVKFADLNNDEIPELVVAQRGNKLNDWLLVFEWNGQGFVKNKEKINNTDKTSDLLRPSNLASYANIFSTAFSTPTRNASVFSLALDEGKPIKSNAQSHTTPLISNGYGLVYVGVFSHGSDGFAALISPEGDSLKTSVFSLSDLGQTIDSDILALNGSRVILGPDIQSFDENNDGNQELLVPFATGEIYSLALTDSGLTFTENKLSQLDLFGMKSAAGEDEINNAILGRVEAGLYVPPLGVDQSSIKDSLLILVSDTLMLGDTLNLFVLPRSSSEFYSFKWLAAPPSGMKFNPTDFTVEWIPTREHIGVADLSYSLGLRLKEELISGEDAFGDVHHIHPIVEGLDSSFVVLIGDTIKPPKPFILIPPRFHRINISTKDIKETDRFTFNGETPFSTNTINSNGVITVGVSANLSWVKQNKAGAFSFKSSVQKPDSIVTLSIIHDLSNNILYSSLSPAVDSTSQSFDVEGWDSKRYKFPEYFFEGFPAKMGLDSSKNGIISLLSSEEKISGTISVSSPLFDQQHELKISYYGGRPHAIRGDINVKENGSHKTLTEIDFESSFLPTSIYSWLKPVNRDTLVFHADSLPDTLKSQIAFRSFYAPATIIKKMSTKTIPDTSLNNSDSLESSTPVALPDSSLIETSPLTPISPIKSSVGDSLLVSPDTSSVDINSDSLVISTPVALPDSTK